MNVFLYFKKYLNRDIALQCLDYYEENDIFLSTGDEYFLLKEELTDKKISYMDMAKFINETRGSQFSFFRKYNPIIYKMYHNNKNDKLPVEQNLDIAKSIFIKPNFQDGLFCKKLSKIIRQNRDKEYLIVDLRHSAGGSVKNCAALCNMLLPKCDIFTQNFKNRTVTYLSDEDSFKFKKVFVLVDKFTASSSEIFAYSLKTHLKNCVLIGEPTYGKTVGQDIITNKKYGFILSVVSFKWHIDGFSYKDIEIVKPSSCDNFIDTIVERM